MKNRIPTLDEYITEQSKTTYDYGCLMINVDATGWSEFVNEIIDTDDIYTENNGYGIETEPHVTVLYGLHDGIDMKKLKSVLCTLSDVDIVSNKIGIFENEKYDVLKYDIDSTKLHILNSIVSENFEYTSDYPDYHPHITIAYLKPGLGKKYAKELEETKEFKPEEYTYSFPSGDKEFFKL